MQWLAWTRIIPPICQLALLVSAAIMPTGVQATQEEHQCVCDCPAGAPPGPRHSGRQRARQHRRNISLGGLALSPGALSMRSAYCVSSAAERCTLHWMSCNDKAPLCMWFACGCLPCIAFTLDNRSTTVPVGYKGGHYNPVRLLRNAPENPRHIGTKSHDSHPEVQQCMRMRQRHSEESTL